MARPSLSPADLARSPSDVARGLPAWARGEPAEAALQTLAASSRELYRRVYTLWVWTGRTSAAEPVWALPVPAAVTAAFAPKEPAGALVRCLQAAVLAEADPAGLRLLDWHGTTCIVAPGLDEEIAGAALAEEHPSGRVAVASLPPEVRPAGPEIVLRPLGDGGGDGLGRLARALGVHPVEVALTLVAHGQPAEQESYHPALARSLREWGCAGEPPPPDAAPAPSLAIEDDPCPLRRHARTVLQRMLRMGKVGEQHHTEFAHFARGAAAHERRRALEVGEALIRAGLLGQKPSVGQRHVYLSVPRLSSIHALIERGETSDPELAEMWTAPPPGLSGSPPAR